MFYIITSILVCLNTTNVFGQQNTGLDFSHHIKTINWTEINANKPQFIIHKATEGSSFIDKKYNERKQIATKSKIPFGAYHFFSYKSSGVKQAQHFIKTAQLNKGDVLPVLDLELSPNMPNKQIWIKEVKAFISEIEKHYNSSPIIYCEEEFYFNYLKDDFKDHKFWIANYINKPKTNYLIWQYSKTGKKYKMHGLDLNLLNPNISIQDILIN